MQRNLALKSLVAEGRRGVQFPAIKVLAGNTLYVGHLGTDEQVAERFRYGLSEEIYNAKKPKRAEADAAAAQVMVQADELARALGDPSGEEESFSLLNCQIWPASGGDGVEVAAVQIPYTAVDGWWLGAQKRLTKKGGGGFFAGVLLPIELPE